MWYFKGASIMSRKNIVNGLLWLGLNSVAILASRYYELTPAPRYYDPYRNSNQRYFDVYQDSKPESSLNSYDSYPSQKYIYPKAPAPSYPRNSFYGRPSAYVSKEHDKDDKDEIKFNSEVIDKFDLQSDFGNFDSVHALPDDHHAHQKTKKKTENSFNRKGRPKFKTSKNHSEENSSMFDYNYLTNHDKIPRLDLTNKNDRLLKAKINNLVKLYVYKLFKKLHQNGDALDSTKEEWTPDASEDFEGDIETLVDSYESGLSDSLFDSLEGVKNALNKTKGKFLDASKLLMIKNSTQYLAKKFISLFTIVKFANLPCTGTNGAIMYEGTCYYESECQARNGTAMGSCADGYGVCCVFIRSCGASSSQNCSYFESPNYPHYYPTNGTIVPPGLSPGTIDPRLRYQLMMYLARQESTSNSLSCLFQVIKMSSDVRQLRVEFLDLELRGPTNGTCVNERLIITGQNRQDLIPEICGYNTGQHVYVDVTGVSGPIQFGVLATAIERKRFRIKVCQITDCESPLNCLQYFTGRTGLISSLNYDQASSLSRSVPGYFNNLNYGICIRKEQGYCTITYTTISNGTSNPFEVVNFDAGGMSLHTPGQAGTETFSCQDDYIVLNGIRLCGDRLNDATGGGDITQSIPITDISGGPFILPFRTNRAATGRGFKLMYTQNPCP